MSRHTENVMDELPDLRSDADVDALMARLRARIAPPPARVAVSEAGAAASPDGIRDLLALQEALASAVARAMTAMVEALEEFGVDEAAGARRGPRPRTTRRRRKP
jgi:hypothetical protein